MPAHLALQSRSLRFTRLDCLVDGVRRLCLLLPPFIGCTWFLRRRGELLGLGRFDFHPRRQTLVLCAAKS
jgi:hypothetical protein